MKKALAIDGNSLFYRFYYATQNQVEFALKNHWTPNNGIKLMLSSINKIMSSGYYDYVFIAFDHGKKTFRHEMVEDYKSGRAATPDELIKQMKDAIITLEAMGYCVMSKEGIEADDLIGSFATLMSKNNIKCDVFSSDKDLLQLVNENITVKLIRTGLSQIEEYTLQNFGEKFYHLHPKQIIEYKAIVGDKSDNLPGINGIGEKTGIKLLQEYQSLDNIYNNLSTLSPKYQEKFIEHKDIAYQCKKLATILLDQFENHQVNEFIIKTKNIDTIKSIIDKYKLSSLTFLLEDKLF